MLHVRKHSCLVTTLHMMYDCVLHQKLNGCFDLAVVILAGVLSDTKEDKSLSFLVILRKIS